MLTHAEGGLTRFSSRLYLIINPNSREWFETVFIVTGDQDPRLQRTDLCIRGVDINLLLLVRQLIEILSWVRVPG